MTDQAAAKIARETTFVCTCQKTMRFDGSELGKLTAATADLTIVNDLCRTQQALFEKALAAGQPLHIACTQEAPLFRELAAERGANVSMRFTNVRERAGWTTDTANVVPKMIALLAEARHNPIPARLTTLKSDGVCLVYGPGQIALDAAAELADRLSVSVLLSEAANVAPPAVAKVPIAKGTIARARGHLGAFEIEVDGYAGSVPSSRHALEFVMPRNGAKSTCDVIVDVSGRMPLFSDGARRDGYLRADPSRPAEVYKALLKATDFVGEFEKPLYVAYDAGICAHARSEKVGCSKCIDVCPTGAITPSGDQVKIDTAVCGGCGMCASVCPTGAASYTFPQRSDVLARLQLLLSAYRGAGGTRPVLLLHEEKHGGDVISALARHGAGLPANVLPVSLHQVTALGHEVLASALVLGAEHVVVLLAPEHEDEAAALRAELDLTRAFLTGLGYAGARLHDFASSDPDALAETLRALPSVTALKPEAFAFGGSKRDIARTALAKLHEQAPTPVDLLPLPEGAPYGRIAIDTAGCTLCLACVGACPANALADHPERPQVSLTAAACVQCGICVATCPEKVITRQPGYDFTNAGFNPVMLHGEEPFHCVSCSKPFGTKATINRVLEKLKGRHAMFQTEQQLRLIQMCDTCRIVTLSESGNDPMRLGERPRVITTDDYIAARAANKKKPTPDDFLS
jgi:ferredoxin